jgi:hypothetical protein
MTINIQEMQRKLNKLQNKGKDSTQSVFWKVPQGVSEIRALPSEDGDPFKEYFFHYGVGSKTLMCPKRNFGEECAICDFATKLLKEGGDENVKAAKELFAKQRFSTTVLIRGDEKSGPKIWSYSKTIYEELLKISLDPDFGDITDRESGFDLKIEKSKVDGQKWDKITVKVKPKSSPMCKSMTAEECEEVLTKTPDYSVLFVRNTSKEVAAALDEHLASPPDESSTGIEMGGNSTESAVDAAIRELG